MQARLREPAPVPATTPVGEVTQSLWGAIASYFRFHPPSEERARQLEDMVNRHRSDLHGSVFYVGKQNLRDRIQKAQHKYSDEYRAL